MQELSRGANCPVPSSTVTVSVACASPVDVSALLLAPVGKVRSDADLVFYNNATGPGVRYLATGPRGVAAVVVDTAAVPEEVTRVAVTASLDGSGPTTFSGAGSMVVTVLDGAGTDAVRFDITGLTTEAAIVCLDVYQRNGAWRLRAVGQGYDDGLAGIARDFGVEVDDTPAVVPAVAVPSPTATVNLDKGRVSLAKQQTVSLVKTGAPALTTVAMGLGWDPAKAGANIDLDASVIAFDAGGKDVDKIWFMSKQAYKGAIRHSGDNLTGAGDGDDEVITVDLSKVPAHVVALVFTVNSFSGQGLNSVSSAYCRLLDVSGGRSEELVRFDLTDTKPTTGVLMCKLVRSGESLSMTALGEFSDGKTVRKMVEPARAAL